MGARVGTGPLGLGPLPDARGRQQVLKAQAAGFLGSEEVVRIGAQKRARTRYKASALDDDPTSLERKGHGCCSVD